MHKHGLRLQNPPRTLPAIDPSQNAAILLKPRTSRSLPHSPKGSQRHAGLDHSNNNKTNVFESSHHSRTPPRHKPNSSPRSRHAKPLHLALTSCMSNPRNQRQRLPDVRHGRMRIENRTITDPGVACTERAQPVEGNKQQAILRPTTTPQKTKNHKNSIKHSSSPMRKLIALGRHHHSSSGMVCPTTQAPQDPNHTRRKHLSRTKGDSKQPSLSIAKLMLISITSQET